MSFPVEKIAEQEGRILLDGGNEQLGKGKGWDGIVHPQGQF